MYNLQLKLEYKCNNITTMHSENVIYWPDRSNRTFCNYGDVLYLLVHYCIHYHIWLLITWNMASVDEELNLILVFKINLNLNNHILLLAMTS